MTQLLTPREGVETSGVPFAITDRCFIPRERYYDAAFFDLENEKLWPHVWQMACRLEEIPNVGDFVEYWVAEYSVLIVRTAPDEIKAYQNTCRHRATQLAKGSGTFRGGQIACPFHGWRWNLDGSPSFLYGSEGFEPRCLNAKDVSLVECRVGLWANCVFINMDPDAPSLLEALEPLPSLLDPLEIGNMYVYWWKAIRLKANWKMALEAFMEGWHVMGTHPQLTMGAGDKFPPNFLDHLWTYPNGHARLEQGHDNDVQSELGLSDMSEAEQTIAFSRLMLEGNDAQVLPKDMHVLEGLRKVACEPGQFSQKMMEALYAWNIGAGIKLPEPDPETLGRWGSNWYVFPNFSVHPLFGNAIIYRSRPDSTDPEHCYFEVWAVTLYPEGQEPGKPVFGGEHRGDDERAWPIIPRQDFSNIERQQCGLHNPGFEAIRLASKYEGGIANMHAHIDTYLAG